MIIAGTEVNYAHNPTNDRRRCLVFPYNSIDDIADAYQKFGQEILGGREYFKNMDNYFSDIQKEVLAGDEKPDYKSAYCFDLTYVLSNEEELREKEILKRNEHIKLFSEYLFNKGIAVAEKLPVKLSEDTENKLYDAILRQIE